MLEKRIEQHLSKKVKELGGLSLKWISTITGVPDRIVFLKKQIHLVELKTETGKLSARQHVVFKELSDLGFPVTVLKSKKDVDEFIRQKNLDDELPFHKEGSPKGLQKRCDAKG
jgi:hypothetical protein